MSKGKKSQKRVIKTIKTKEGEPAKVAQSRAARSTQRTTTTTSTIPLIFNKQNYILMGVGVLLIALGLMLMAGGGSEDPAVFDSDRIYSFRRITLAPFLLILGLVVEIYAIFKK